MTQQEIFDYLKENMTLDVDRLHGGNYGYDHEGVEVNLYLRNPATGKMEIISGGSCGVK